MSKQHTVWSLIFALVILLVLAVMPAQAQAQTGLVRVGVSFYCADYGAWGRAQSPVPNGTATLDGNTSWISPRGYASFYVPRGNYALSVNGVIVGRIYVYGNVNRGFGILCG